MSMRKPFGYLAAVAAFGSFACGAGSVSGGARAADAAAPLEDEAPTGSPESAPGTEHVGVEPAPAVEPRMTPDAFFGEPQQFQHAECPATACVAYVGNPTWCECDDEGRVRVSTARFMDDGTLEERTRYFEDDRWERVGVRTTSEGDVMWVSFDRGVGDFVEESWSDSDADGARDSWTVATRTVASDGSATIVERVDWDGDGVDDSCETADLQTDRLLQRAYDEGCDGVVERTYVYADCVPPHAACVAVGHDVGLAPDAFAGDFVLDGAVRPPSTDPAEYGLPADLESGEALPGEPARACTDPSELCPDPDTEDCRCEPNGRVSVRVIAPDEWSYEDSYVRYRYDAEGRLVLTQADLGPQYVASVVRRFFDSRGRVAATVTATDYDLTTVTRFEYDGDRVIATHVDRDGDRVVDTVTWLEYEGDRLVRSRVDEDGDGAPDLVNEYVRDETSDLFIGVRVRFPDEADGYGPLECYYDAPCEDPFGDCGEAYDCY